MDLRLHYTAQVRNEGQEDAGQGEEEAGNEKAEKEAAGAGAHAGDAILSVSHGPGDVNNPPAGANSNREVTEMAKKAVKKGKKLSGKKVTQKVQTLSDRRGGLVA